MANRRASLYSPSRRAPAAAVPSPGAASGRPVSAAPAAAPVAPEAAAGPAVAPARRGWRQRLRRALPVLAGGAFAAALVLAALLVAGRGPAGLPVTQALIDAAVRHSLENEPLPSQYAKAYAQVAPSVVRVVGLLDDEDDASEQPDRRAMDRSLGSGVVIKDDGTILTNLHVVHGAKKLRVTFANGQQSDAALIGMQPENDLAVIKALQPPAELEPATMRSTGDLMPGDHVIAVGHPFGIGPSVSAGIVSGLQREFRAADGERALTNLIQFDAAANPGNSGGPLVTADGYVVGIVTAILNPNEQSTFVGIGFAVPIENAAAAAGLSPF
jgi:S1-C subfamily serine protease